MRTYLAGKIHGIVVTGTQIAYTESVAIGADIMSAAGIDPFEQVEVTNLATGARFTTYAVPGQPGSFLVNGAAARLASPGDRCAVMSYALADAFTGANMVVVGGDNTFVADYAFPYTLSAQSPDQAATPAPEQAPAPAADAQQPADGQPVPIPQQAPAASNVPQDAQSVEPFADGGPVQAASPAPDAQQPADGQPVAAQPVSA